MAVGVAPGKELRREVHAVRSRMPPTPDVDACHTWSGDGFLQQHVPRVGRSWQIEVQAIPLPDAGAEAASHVPVDPLAAEQAHIGHGGGGGRWAVPSWGDEDSRDIL